MVSRAIWKPRIDNVSHKFFFSRPGSIFPHMAHRVLMSAEPRSCSRVAHATSRLCSCCAQSEHHFRWVPQLSVVNARIMVRLWVRLGGTALRQPITVTVGGEQQRPAALRKVLPPVLTGKHAGRSNSYYSAVGYDFYDFLQFLKFSDDRCLSSQRELS